MPTWKLPLPRKFSYPDPSSLERGEAQTPISKAVGLTDTLHGLGWPGLSRLIYSRILQGVQSCSTSQALDLSRTPSLHKESLFSGDVPILYVKYLIPHSRSTLSSKTEQKIYCVSRQGLQQALTVTGPLT